MGPSERTGRIDAISSYCDSRCERCAFTMRCSTYLTKAAIAMCGDAKEGLELALGELQPVGGARREMRAGGLADLNDDITAAEKAKLLKEAEECDRRVRDSAISQLAHACGILAWRWLNERRDGVDSAADAVLAEALETVSCDAFLIGAKLHRALHGRDQHDHGEDDDLEDDPRRNDWNRSAKVALISLTRSETAWRLIAQATGDETPLALADQLGALRADVERAFPDAWSAIRPGFDE